MKIKVSEKKRELIIIFVTTLIIAFLVGFSANIAFNYLFSKSPIWFSVATCIFLIISIIILYLTIVSTAQRSSVKISFPLTFSRKKVKFFDLPHCPISVHSRVCFNYLPVESQKHLACYDNYVHFWKSDLQRFIDHVIQEALLTTVFKQREFYERNYVEITYSSLPDGIKENRFLEKWMDVSKEDYAIFVPSPIGIKTYGRNNSFLRIETCYGVLRCEWDIIYCQAPIYSKYFVNEKDLKPVEDYHDFYINLSLFYECNIWKLLSKELKLFLQWAGDIELELVEYDWDKAKIDRLFFVIKGEIENENASPQK